MEIFTQIWGSVSYVGAVVLANVLVGFDFTRKRGYWLRVLASFAVICTLSFGIEQWVGGLELSMYPRITLRTTNCLMVFMLSIGMMRFCCECSAWQSLFCVTTSYCLEHISQRVYSIIQILPAYHGSPLLNAFLLIFARAALYVPFYFLVIRKLDLNQVETDNKIQIVATLIIVIFAIYVSAFASTLASPVNSRVLSLLIYLYSIVLCVLGLFVELYQLLFKRVTTERDLLQKLLYQEAEQYHREKDAIDVINVKYHDLKHQLHILESQYGREQLKNMREAIDGYDTLMRTGNIALDTVLSMKSYNCLNKQIQLTCMADGKQLNRLSEADIYSLFGNMLDNAIEAVETLPVEKRIISLHVFAQNGFVFIRCENYCGKAPQFQNGMPMTTKENKDYHGYGSHSLCLVAEKYKGLCTFNLKDDVFYTDIVLPSEA